MGRWSTSLGPSLTNRPGPIASSFSVAPKVAYWTSRLVVGATAAYVIDVGGAAIPFTADGALDVAALASHGDSVVTQLNDQSGNAKHMTVPVTVPSSVGPTAYASGVPTEGGWPAMRFSGTPVTGPGNPLVANLTAFGFNDPPLTVAWKMRSTAGSGDFPSVWTLGNGLNVFVNNATDLFGAPAASDILYAYDFDGTAYVGWTLPLNATLSYHGWVLTKPGAGYSADWRLWMDGVPLGGPTDVEAGAMPGPYDRLALGTWSDNTSSPFLGDIPGLILWDSVLGPGDLATLQSFLQAH